MRCRDCCFFDKGFEESIKESIDPIIGNCFRYPNWEKVNFNHYCGEFKSTTNTNEFESKLKEIRQKNGEWIINKIIYLYMNKVEITEIARLFNLNPENITVIIEDYKKNNPCI